MNNTGLFELVEKFLADNYVFRQLDIYEMFDNARAIWTPRKGGHYRPEYDNESETCNLLDDHVFDGWTTLDKTHVKIFVSEFLFKNSISNTTKFKKADVKAAVIDIIESKKIIKKITFSPAVKECIGEGRVKVKGVRPLSSNKERIKIKAHVGEKYYLCQSSRPPFIASPCYVIKADSDSRSYRVMFFTNLDNELSETSKTKINGWGFTTAYSNEIGRTPREAVLQRQN